MCIEMCIEFILELANAPLLLVLLLVVSFPSPRSNLSSPDQSAIFAVSDFLYYLNSIASDFSQSP